MPELAEYPTLAELAAAQGGALHWDQCRAAGFTRSEYRWLLDSGRWRQLLPRVIATFSGPVPPLTRMHAALLYAGPGSALSHQSAGAWWGLCPLPGAVHVVVPYGRNIRDQPWVKIHRSRSLQDSDLHPALSPLRTRIERTVIDLLGTCKDADSALSLIAEAVRSRRTTPELLRGVLACSPRTRWRGEALTALPDVAAGAHSLLEIIDARLRRRHGLPQGRRQFTRRKGGVEHLDVHIEEFATHVELDGRLGHSRGSEVWRDFRRDNKSVVDRLRHLRYGWTDMLGHGCEVMIQQAIVLRQQGWRDQFRPCPRCPRPLPPEVGEP